MYQTFREFRDSKNTGVPLPPSGMLASKPAGLYERWSLLGLLPWVSTCSDTISGIWLLTVGLLAKIPPREIPRLYPGLIQEQLQYWQWP